MDTLTERQKEVLEAIKERCSPNRCHATIRELGEALGIDSTNGVVCHLMALERKGAIKRHLGVRGIEVLEDSE